MAEHRPSIQEMVEGTKKEKTPKARKDWVGFVESEAVHFMHINDMEKMTLDDGMGNKAKLTRRKDGSIYVESTSSNVL